MQWAVQDIVMLVVSFEFDRDISIQWTLSYVFFLIYHLILTFYFYTSYTWNETFTISAKLFAVLVGAM